MNTDEPVRAHVGDDYANYAQWDTEDSGNFCHRTPVAAELQNGLLFRRENGKIPRLQDCRSHYRLDGYLIARLCPAARYGIRPNKSRTSILLDGKAETGATGR
jgi:hypothetical protein